jgi:hypothetical protein
MSRKNPLPLHDRIQIPSEPPPGYLDNLKDRADRGEELDWNEKAILDRARGIDTETSWKNFY